jgi:hypothetical protein
LRSKIYITDTQSSTSGIVSIVKTTIEGLLDGPSDTQLLPQPSSSQLCISTFTEVAGTLLKDAPEITPGFQVLHGTLSAPYTLEHPEYIPGPAV